MQKHKDGSVKFTQEEIAEITQAYTALHDLIERFPTTMSDFFSRKSYTLIVKWYEQLQGRAFVYSEPTIPVCIGQMMGPDGVKYEC